MSAASPGEPAALAAHHRKMLERDSAINPEVIAARGYWSAADWLALKAGGVHLKSTQLHVACFPALVIPNHDPTGEYVYSAVRWDHPRTGGKGQPVRYDQPAGVKLRLDVPPPCLPGLRDPDQTLWWTEGARKADALASHGVIVVNTPGVTAWQSYNAIPDLFGIPLKGRRVVCAYDSDMLTKPPVQRAVMNLARWMTQKGAEVHVLDWTRLAA